MARMTPEEIISALKLKGNGGIGASPRSRATISVTQLAKPGSTMKTSLFIGWVWTRTE
jgi:hypothetical protein